MTTPLSPELERQYNLRLLRPDFEAQVLPQWLARSAAMRASADALLDLRYGPAERERIDLFPAADPKAPLLVFFHGGYWQRGDKSIYSFVAEALVAHGVAVALVNYDLCPSVRIEQIVAQARRAMAWLWQRATHLPCALDRCVVSGHSAGGHLAARLMSTHWPAVDAGMPLAPWRGAILVSAVFDLLPLLQTSLNEGLRLDLDEARAASPLQHPPTSAAPQLLAVGDRETPQFHDQAERYARAFAGIASPMPRFTAAGCDHFDVVQALADASHPLFQRVLAFIKKET